MRSFMFFFFLPARIDVLILVPPPPQSNIQHLANRALVIADQDVTHGLFLLWRHFGLRLLPGPGDRRGLGRRFPGPCDATEEQTRYLAPPLIGPKPCLRAPAKSDTRWPSPTRCH